MTKRPTPHRTAKIAIIAILAGFVLSTQPVSAGPAVEPGRTVQQLSDGWRFQFGNPADDASAVGFNDAAWEKVAVPHTWNRVGNYGAMRRSDVNLARGTGWYRLHFQPPAASSAKRIFLQFDAASIVADVWLNGVRLGSHAGAFSRFCFDATAAVRPGDNVLAVKVDNSEPVAGSPTADVVPISGDFFMYGGLYRPVSVIAVGGAHIDLLDFGGPGVYESIARLDDQQASVDVGTRVRNDNAQDMPVAVETVVTDAKGRVVARDQRQVSVAPGATVESVAALRIAKPHRWNGRTDPYLYQVKVLLRGIDGRLLDRIVQPLGLREIKIDANRGLFLNGQHLKLHGVNRHQDREDKGWAISDADLAQDMKLIEELGANTVRMSHYNQAEPFYRLADHNGMIVWAELGLVNLTAPKGERDTPPAMLASAEQQLKELIRQNYNHPSVAVWSIGNEVTNWSSKGLTPPNARPTMEALNKIAKAEDSTRPTAMAVCCEPLPGEPDKGQERVSGISDTVGYNLYLGWYSNGHVEDAARLGTVMQALHDTHPGLPIGIGEYGAGGSITQHTDNVYGGKLESVARPQPEEAEAAIHALSWKAVAPLAFLWSSYVWQMFDNASLVRQEGDGVDVNTKGLVTFDRKTKKDAYYFYQAAWRKDAPVLHLAERRYVDRAYRVVDVRAYANLDTARLSLNGRDLGAVTCNDWVCVWPRVELASGTNTLIATGQRGGKDVRDRIVWTYNGPDRALHVRTGSLAGVRLENGLRYGSDNYFEGGTGYTLNPRQREIYGANTPGGKPGKIVTGTATPHLYASWRAGKGFAYALPLPNGRYTVTVHLFEPTEQAAGARVFSVSASGGAKIDKVDPFAQAGGALKATNVILPAIAEGDVLRLAFSAQAGEALVSAIDVVPVDDARQ